MKMKEAIVNRRSNYGITAASPISDNELKELIEFVVKHVPSAFNSQSTRIVLLLGENHKRLWEITKEELGKRLSPEQQAATNRKIDNAFAAGYGTILFYEDEGTVEAFQQQFPTYKDNFPVWSQHTSGMHQFAIWTLLLDAGLGASLQHYNPLIDQSVANEWGISPKWKLVAQMPFGVAQPVTAEKQVIPLNERVLVFR